MATEIQAVFGLFILFYSLIQKRLFAAYISAASLAIAVNSWLQVQHLDFSYVLFGLAVLYFAVGTFLPTSSKFQPWSRAARISGLTFAGLVAFYTQMERPLQEDANIYLLVIALFLASQLINKNKKSDPNYLLLQQVGTGLLSLGALAQVMDLGIQLASHAAVILALFALMFALFSWRISRLQLLFIPAAALIGCPCARPRGSSAALFSC
jgi:hypothetical protein